jgi:nitroreductase
MNFIELATRRSSIRDFERKPVEKEKLLYILEAARMAPSAVNFQPWKFIVITKPELLESVQSVYHRQWLTTAPVIIIALGNHQKGWRRKSDDKDFTEIDVAIAIDHLTLAATEQGLGTCWICNFDVEKCNQLLNIPDHLEPIALIPVGYPVQQPYLKKKRESLDRLVTWDAI